MSPFPPTDDPLVLALQALLEREGGHVVVGDRAQINDQTLYQIAYLKPHSRTGKPKSVGTSVRERLSAAYPDWMELRPIQLAARLIATEQTRVYNGPPTATKRPLQEALAVLGDALAMDLPDDVRQDAADLLSKLALRQGAERHQAELLTLLDEATAPARHAANSR